MHVMSYFSHNYVNADVIIQKIYFMDTKLCLKVEVDDMTRAAP